MIVDGSMVQKNSRKIGSMIHLFPQQKMVDVGKLISFWNLSNRGITCLVFPTMSVHLILSCAK